VEGSAFSIRGASKTGALAFEMWDAATNQVSPQGWPFRIKQHSFAGFFSKYQSAQGRSKAARCMRRIFYNGNRDPEWPRSCGLCFKPVSNEITK
jgi:hypothetical protein